MSTLPSYAKNWSCFTDRNPHITNERLTERKPEKITTRQAEQKHIEEKRRAQAIEVRKMRTGTSKLTFKQIAKKLGISSDTAAKLNRQINEGYFS